MRGESVILSLIVARADNGTIGINNELPWHISSDLKNFKRVTAGKPVIMGRKTYESIGKPLMRRTNIVVTRKKDWSPAGVVVCHNITDALKTARAQALVDKVNEVMVIGGAEIYARLMIAADRIYLTEVHKSFEGDCCFADLDRNDWHEVSRERFVPEDIGGPSYSFVVLARR